MNRVFVTQRPTKPMNLQLAERHGTVIVLMDDVQSLQASLFCQDMIKRQMATFTDEDYIVPLGSPSVIGVVCALAMKANNGRCKLLAWNKFSNSYDIIQIDTERDNLWNRM